MGLATNVDDVAVVLRNEVDSGEALLVCHSYGGIVATQVADRERVDGIIYLDRFIPRDGQSLLDIEPR